MPTNTTQRGPVGPNGAPHPIPGDPLLKFNDCVKYLGTSRERLRQLVNAGKIAAVRDDRFLKIRLSELDRYIAELPAYEPPAATRRQCGTS